MNFLVIPNRLLAPNHHALPHNFQEPFLVSRITIPHNKQRNKEKTAMSFFAHIFNKPVQHADDFGVFHASQKQKSQH
tara:strand:- start:476 stop:706 length:231 start_codon:yes stop_codon:yes gene_type:complete